MKKNEIKNFFKQYKNTVCLNSCLKPMKLVGCLGDGTSFECLFDDGTTVEVLPSDKIIALKGRIKEKDYNYIEARFNKQWKQ